MKLFESRHRAAKSNLARRTFLKAIGLGISAPLAYKMARLATANEIARPTRLFLFYLPHGLPPEHWDVGDAMDFSMSGLGILSGLEAYREYVTVVRGVGINTSDNHAAIRSVFTGAEGSNSIDYDIATQLNTTAHVLGAYANPEVAGDTGKCLFHGGWVDPTANPADALDDLFAGLSEGGSAPSSAGEPSLEAQFRAEGLALTEGELERMQSELSALTGEKNKLGVHLESLRAYRSASEGGSGLVSCTSRPVLDSVTKVAGLDAMNPANLGAVFEAHLEAAAHALLCGSSRVISLQAMYSNAQVLMNFAGGPDIALNHHDPLSHSGEEDATGRENFAKCQKWFYDKLAEKFLSVLAQDDPADPGRSALENTTILTMSEISDGKTHTSAYTPEAWDVPGYADNPSGPRETYIPTMIIGKGGGAFKGGQAVYVPGADHRDLLATAAKGMGVELTSIGGKNTTPIAEVLA